MSAQTPAPPTTTAPLPPSSGRHPGDRRSAPPTTSEGVDRLESHANTCLDNYYDVHFSFVPSVKPLIHPNSSYSITNCQAYKLYRSDRNHTTDYVIHVCSVTMFCIQAYLVVIIIMPILLLHLYSGALTRTRKLRLIAAYARLGGVPRPEDGTQGQ